MPPKTKKAPSAASNEVYYEEQQLADDIAICEERLKALKHIYLNRLESLAERKQRQLTLAATLEAHRAEYDAKKTEKTDVLTDCTRIYKVGERKSVGEITVQDAAFTVLQDAKRKLLEQLDSCGTDFDGRIKAKKREFESLCDRVGEMEKEFAVLLSDVEQCAP